MTTQKKTTKKASAKTVKKSPAKKVSAKDDAPVFSIHDDKTGKFMPIRDAKPIKISGFADLQFFVHRNSGGRPWCISEASSGGRIANGNTRADAVNAARETLKKHSREDILKTIYESISRTGVAPGFQPPAGAKMETAVCMPPQPTEYKPAPAKRGRKPSGRCPTGKVVDTEIKINEGSDPCVHKKDRRGQGLATSSRQSQLDIAVSVLREAAEPLTCKEIVRRMLEGGLWQTSGRTPGATLSASMQREIAKHGKDARFVRTARGLYGLNE